MKSYKLFGSNSTNLTLSHYNEETDDEVKMRHKVFYSWDTEIESKSKSYRVDDIDPPIPSWSNLDMDDVVELLQEKLDSEFPEPPDYLDD